MLTASCLAEIRERIRDNCGLKDLCYQLLDEVERRGEIIDSMIEVLNKKEGDLRHQEHLEYMEILRRLQQSFSSNPAPRAREEKK